MTKVRKGQIVVITNFNAGNMLGSITKVLATEPKKGVIRSDDGFKNSLPVPSYPNSIFVECVGKRTSNKTYLNKPFWWETNYRLATEEEKKAYHKGITNIKDIK